MTPGELEKAQLSQATTALDSSATLDHSTQHRSKVAIKSQAVRSWRCYLFVIICLIACTALGLALQATVENQRLQHTYDKQYIQLSNKILLLNSQLQTRNASALTAGQKHQNLLSSIQQQLDQQNRQVHTLLRQHNYQQQDWLLLNARYYLELAQINAHWTDNQQTTQALLQQADLILQPVSIQGLLPLRQTIAKEILTINSLPLLDKPGLLSRLDAIESILLKLSVNPSKRALFRGNNQTINAVNNNVTTNFWRIKLQESLENLKKLVIINHQTSDDALIFSPVHRSLLREAIGLDLHLIKWAILQNNNAIYQYFLAQTIQEIQTIFDPNDSSVATALKQLNQLQQINLQSHQPDISQSLLLLNQLINEKDKPTLDKEVKS